MPAIKGITISQKLYHQVNKRIFYCICSGLMMFSYVFFVPMQALALAVPYYPNTILMAENSASTQNFQKIQKKAEQGNVEAQYKLGDMYYRLRGIDQDMTKAKYWFEQAAKHGHAEAQADLGGMYASNYGKVKDIQKALYWFEQSAKQDNATAQSWLGYVYSEGKDVPKDMAKAVHYYELSAQQGKVQDQVTLANIYYKGLGIKKDYAKAKYWFEQSANNGNALAEYKLGLMHYRGHGIEKDYEKARAYYVVPAKRGLDWAQYELGTMYYDGKGGEQDYQTATSLFQQSATQGYAEAQYRLGIMFFESQEDSYENMVIGMHWLDKAADQGHIDALHYIIDELGDNIDKKLDPGIALDYAYVLSKAYGYLILLIRLEPDNKDNKILEKKYLAKLTPDYIENAQTKANELWEDIKTHKKNYPHLEIEHGF